MCLLFVLISYVSKTSIFLLSFYEQFLYILVPMLQFYDSLILPKTNNNGLKHKKNGRIKTKF